MSIKEKIFASSSNRERRALAPSLLAANPLHIAEEINSIENLVSTLHLDIMDGHYVPNMNGQVSMVKAIRDNYSHVLDVHLMVTNPDKVMDLYLDAGADIITIHQEVLGHHHRMLNYIRERGALAGISLNPGTPIESLSELLPSLDLILIMSVNPGYGGQAFISQSLDKISRLKTMINNSGHDIIIEIDGGVNQQNASNIWQAGADLLVAGSAVFKAENRKIAVNNILEA